MLEPYEGKLSRTVLRGERDSNIPDLLDRPDHLIQRNGRILRQGNENAQVEIFNYVTEGSFDSYLWQILENKQKFISQVMTEKSPLRSCDDIDEVVLSYGEIKAIAMKNPFLKEKMQIDTEINKINLLKSSWLESKQMFKNVINNIPDRIEKLKNSMQKIQADIKIYEENKKPDFEITLNGKTFDERAKAGEYLMELINKISREKPTNDIEQIGSYNGFKIGFTYTMGVSKIYVMGNKTYDKELGLSGLGNITRIENLAKDIGENLSLYEDRLKETEQKLNQAKEEIDKPFEHEERLSYLLKRKVEIDYKIERGITTNDEMEELGEQKEPSTEHKQNEHQSEQPSTEQSQYTTEENKNTIEHQLYNTLYQWGNKVLDKEIDYISMKQEDFDDLVLEYIGEGEYSLAHYSELNGDMMRSPEITFKVEEKEIVPTSYLDDYTATYIEVEDKTDKDYNGILDIFKTWLKNIAIQFYSSIEKLKNQDVEITEEVVQTEEVFETEHYEIDYSDMTVNEIKDYFKEGMVIKLDYMQGENMPSGLIGVVKGVDDIGQVRVSWENGSTLALNVKEDKFEVFEQQYTNEYVEEQEEMWEEIR